MFFITTLHSLTVDFVNNMFIHSADDGSLDRGEELKAISSRFLQISTLTSHRLNIVCSETWNYRVESLDVYISLLGIIG